MKKSNSEIIGCRLFPEIVLVSSSGKNRILIFIGFHYPELRKNITAVMVTVIYGFLVRIFSIDNSSVQLRRDDVQCTNDKNSTYVLVRRTSMHSLYRMRMVVQHTGTPSKLP